MDEQLRKELSDINAGLAELRTNMKAAFKRIDEQKEMADSVHTLALAVERLTHEIKEQRKDLDSVTGDVEKLKQEPANKWKVVTADIMKVVVGGVIGFLLVRLGIK